MAEGAEGFEERLMPDILRVLYVDDEPGLLEIGKLFLEKYGSFSIDSLTSATEALSCISTEHYDAIISDYQMPGMDGIEFLQEVRRSGSDIPFILFTGRGREEVVIEAINNGVDFYLQKGGQPKAMFAELAHKVRQAVQRRRAEMSLFESERRYRLLAEHVRDVIMIAGMDLRLTYVSPSVTALRGLTPEEALNESIEDAMTPDSYRKLMDVRDVGISKKRADKPLPDFYTVELEFYKKDGSTVWTEMVFSPLFDGGKRPTAVVGVIRDISERKKVEQALSESERKFREIFNSTGDIIFLNEFSQNGPPGRFIEVNNAACRIFGYTREELLGMSIKDIEAPQTRDMLADIEAQFRTKGRATFEAVGIRKDGTLISIENSACSFKLENRQVDLAVGRDITDRKKAENALKALNKKLKLLSSITRHDISNQICVLMGYEEMLGKNIDDEKNREYLTPIIEATERIQDQIAFTREYQELGVHSPTWKSVQSVACSAVSNVFAPTVQVRIDTGTLEIFADHMLERVFYNLFENAIRHGEHVTDISVSFHEEDGNGIIVIEDNGVGVAGDMKEMIFDRGVGSNTGFGLFLTREILDITGISISETGTEGKGARFEIIVPKYECRHVL